MTTAKKCSPFTEASNIKQIMQKKIQDFFLFSEDNIARLQIEIDHLDLLTWLNSQNTKEKVFWRDRENIFSVAAIGKAYEIRAETLEEYSDKKRNIQCLPQMRFFGGMRFDVERNAKEIWENVAKISFIIPRFEIYEEDQKTFFIANILCKKNENRTALHQKISNELNDISFICTPIINFNQKYQKRQNIPSSQDWNNNFAKIQNFFIQENVKKIVLARRSQFTYTQNLNGLSLLQYLVNTQNNTYCFYFQWENGKAFLGASPERLYRRQKNKIFSEAIAGTRVRGKNKEEDMQLGQDLLSSKKDTQEHLWVIKNIQQVFTKICKNHQVGSFPTLLKLKSLQHLYGSFHGTLKEHINDKDILSLLHPTAAVCGFPKEKNKKQISKVEAFDRGWFAGPIGWLAKDSAEFAVGIRSCLVDQNKLYLFAGAGVINKSDAMQEWEEIENKMRNFACVFSSY